MPALKHIINPYGRVLATLTLGLFFLITPEIASADDWTLGAGYDLAFDDNRSGVNLLGGSGTEHNISPWDSFAFTSSPGGQVYFPVRRGDDEPFFLRISGHYEFRLGVLDWDEDKFMRFLGIVIRPELHVFAGRAPRAQRGDASFAAGGSVSLIPMCFKVLCPEFSASAYYGLFRTYNLSYSVGLRLIVPRDD